MQFMVKYFSSKTNEKAKEHLKLMKKLKNLWIIKKVMQPPPLAYQLENFWSCHGYFTELWSTTSQIAQFYS